ncbi:type II toxin-antitoxin system RelE/ParE family toxin [Brevundimonas sp. GCM10030266]|uniref:type II toxin-antitoxin system RelE/ParE family toxin n=1 Tax=Brevundimonas sp. GCM10030266 TaxID=3273386 RepID=UPI003605EA4D
MKVILSPRAELDFETQVRWLAAHSPSAGRAAALRIVSAFDLLADFPDIGIRIRGDLREKQVQFGRDGFVIRYRRMRDTVIVLRILHGRQNR